MTHHLLQGLIAATHTPLNDDGSLHLDRIDRFAERLIRDEVGGAFICGTTGEFASLSVDERMQVAGRWRAVVGSELRLVVHVGDTSLPDCQALASHAQQIGVDAISALGPYYYQPRSIEDLVRFTRQVAAAAPGLPFYYYHLPQLTGVHFSMLDYLERGQHDIPTLGGIKYSKTDLEDYGRCISQFGDRFDIPFGADEILLTALALGARGAVGSTYSFMAPLYHRIIGAFRAGNMDEARGEQARSMEVIAVLKRYGGMSAIKACMALTQLDCGPVRPPLCPLTAEQFRAMQLELESLGFFEFCSQLT